MLEKTPEQLAAWKNEMKVYEKNKRTKKPFGKDPIRTEHITHQEIKSKQNLFNPILQTYTQAQSESERVNRDEFSRAKSLMNHIRQHKKYQRPYDIVNLYSGEEPQAQEVDIKKRAPIRNAYNIINNQKLPDIYFQNRELRLPVEREKALIANNKKQFNIVTGEYYSNNEQRLQQQRQKQRHLVEEKYRKTHVYDPVLGHFYDQEKERKYDEERRQRQKQHGKDYEKKLPPSYHLPESLQTIDEKRLNAKKRYQMKYMIEDQYNKRNAEYDDKREKIVNNKIHVGRIEENRAKQFDIITMKQYEPARADELFGRKSNFPPGWVRREPSETGKIKSGGFS